MSNEKPMPMDEPEIIFIKNEEGKDEEYEVVMRFEVEDTGHNYMMVVPVESEEDEEEEVFAFRYTEEGDELLLHLIEDDEEWDIVEETFNTLMEQFDSEELNR
jgi:uncharacterized protein YrzB (UPF0473 family)